jgi:short chain dehydrogenase
MAGRSHASFGWTRRGGVASGGRAAREFANADRAREIIEVNLIAPYLVTQAGIPLLRRYNESNSVKARVINVASWAGMMATPFIGFYNATKAGLAKAGSRQDRRDRRCPQTALQVQPRCRRQGGRRHRHRFLPFTARARLNLRMYRLDRAMTRSELATAAATKQADERACPGQPTVAEASESRRPAGAAPTTRRIPSRTAAVPSLSERAGR